MLLDDLVNLPHQPHRLLERHDDPLVVGDVLRRERAARLAAPVVEPLAADMVAADVKVPHVFWHAVKVRAALEAGRIQVDAPVLQQLDQHRLSLGAGIRKEGDR